MSELCPPVAIEITKQALDTLCLEARASIDGRETGGLVLGRDYGWRIVIASVGTPGPNADRRPDGFLRDLDHSRHLADAAFERDGSVWLGEWHTHPTGGIIPSPIDMATYRRLLVDEKLAFARIVSLVISPRIRHGWDEIIIGLWAVGDRSAALSRVIRANCVEDGGEL